MVQTPGPSTIRPSFKSLPGYTITTSGILITPEGRAIPPTVYNCFGIPRQPLVSVDSNQEEDDNNLCAICGDKASGNHYSVPSCEGCKVYITIFLSKLTESTPEWYTNRTLQMYSFIFSQCYFRL